MAIETDTHVERIALNTADLGKLIQEVCELQSSRDKARRLAAAFTTNGHLVLIFQQSPE